MNHLYGELQLGEDSLKRFLSHTMSAMGFEFQGPQSMQGQSGLIHKVDGLGVRKNNIIVVFSGGAGLRQLHDGSIGENPKEIVEYWARDALLRMYDVASVLRSEGLIVDLLYFQNVLTRDLPDFPGRDLDHWLEENKLPRDIGGTWSTSVDPIEIAHPRFLSDIASSVGACFLGLNDLPLSDISMIVNDSVESKFCNSREALTRARVIQYFNPPTDELLLSSLALTKTKKRTFIDDTFSTALELAREPRQNTIVPTADYNDPVATAVALKEIGAIDFEATVTINEPGRQIVQTIKKTAQENLAFRILRSLELPEIAKAIAKGLRGD